jgi:hypothetical protein
MYIFASTNKINGIELELKYNYNKKLNNIDDYIIEVLLNIIFINYWIIYLTK